MTMTEHPTMEMRLSSIEERLDLLIAEAEQQRRIRESIADLTEDLSPVARQGMASLARALEVADERGYVDFTKGGLEIADRVMTSFTTEDVEALGDNIVLILETIKEMTQPEIMQMLRFTFEHAGEIDESVEPPGLFALLGRLRSPAARRGLYRMIFLLESMGTVHRDDIVVRKEAQK